MLSYKEVKKRFKIDFPSVYKPLNEYKVYVKYLITGTLCTTGDILFLYFLTDIVGLWYLFSTIFVYIFAFFSSFYMQKYWTFKDGRKKIFYEQMFSYFMVGLFNISINTLGVFILVESYNVYYLFAQILMFATLGIESFLIYRFIIFKRKRRMKKIAKKAKKALVDNDGFGL